jgi:hypothetical protein
MLRFNVCSTISARVAACLRISTGDAVPDPPVGILVHPVPNSHYRRGESYSHTNPWRASSRVFPRAALHVTEFLRTTVQISRLRNVQQHVPVCA